MSQVPLIFDSRSLLLLLAAAVRSVLEQSCEERAACAALTDRHSSGSLTVELIRCEAPEAVLVASNVSPASALVLLPLSARLHRV